MLTKHSSATPNDGIPGVKMDLYTQCKLTNIGEYVTCSSFEEAGRAGDWFSKRGYSTKRVQVSARRWNCWKLDRLYKEEEARPTKKMDDQPSITAETFWDAQSDDPAIRVPAREKVLEACYGKPTGIDSGIPIPPTLKGTRAPGKYYEIVKGMKPGDSILVGSKEECQAVFAEMRRQKLPRTTRIQPDRKSSRVWRTA